MRKCGMLSAIAIVLIAGILIAAGCSAAKKPAPGQPGMQVPAAPEQSPMTTSADDVSTMASQLTSIANSVSGVKGATVVISGTTAYVGIEQNEGLEKGDTERIKQDVSNEIKKAEPRLTAVYVSSDPDIITRLRRVADGIAAGQPAAAFGNELTEIARRLSMTP